MIALRSIRSKVGEFWWYSFLLFCALRLGDFVNAFIGLWLVPKYVAPEELGAVLPLTHASFMLGIPISIVATVFTKHLNTLATHQEYGKIKALLRDVFAWSAVLLVIIIVSAQYVLPLVFARISVAKGSLGLLIITSATVTLLAPTYMNALYALKKFNVVAWIHVFSAPIRLCTMLVTMPFRALSGYFVGQTTPPIFMMLASLFALRKELGRDVCAEAYLTPSVRRWMWRYVILTTVHVIPATLAGFVYVLLIRQRLPAEDSAAYYMISRFSEIGSYAGLTLMMVLFPIASEAHERGDHSQKLLWQSILGSWGAGVILAGLFSIIGSHLLAIFPNGSMYARYVPQLIALTLIAAANMAIMCFIQFETAASRFRFVWYYVPILIFEMLAALCLTGYGYFEGWLPATWLSWIASLNAARLDFLLGLMAVGCLLKSIFIAVQLLLRSQVTQSRIQC